MTIRIAINGFGRIGRNITRAMYEGAHRGLFELVAVNDLGIVETTAHLLKYDTVHGRFAHDVDVENGQIVIDGKPIHMYSERNPADIPWAKHDIDVVLECTGFFTKKDGAALHLNSGAKKVLISAPAGSDVKTIVYGVNHDTLTAEDRIVSNASCTTNCLAPLAKVLHETFGIQNGLMTTVHSYTNDQKVTDSFHKDIRRARAAARNMIPTKTGAAAAVGLVLPELNGKLDGLAVRVPTINVSLVDLTFTAKTTPNSVAEINDAVRSAAEGNMKGVLAYCDEPLVSSDYNHNPASSTLDAEQTRLIDNLVKVVAWYDNEWGFSNRMLDTANVMMAR